MNLAPLENTYKYVYPPTAGVTYALQFREMTIEGAPTPQTVLVVATDGLLEAACDNMSAQDLNVKMILIAH